MTPTKGPSHSFELSHADRLCLTCPLPYGCNEANPLCQRRAWLRTRRTGKRPSITTQIVNFLTKADPTTIPDLAKAIDRKRSAVYSTMRRLRQLDLLTTIPAQPEPGQRYVQYYIPKEPSS